MYIISYTYIQVYICELYTCIAHIFKIEIAYIHRRLPQKKKKKKTPNFILLRLLQKEV